MLNLFNMFLSGGPPRANALIQPKSKGRAVRLLHRDGTFNDGRNQEKREARAAEKDLRHDQVAAFQAGLIVFAPKRRMSGDMTDVLANRRLRQTRGGL